MQEVVTDQRSCGRTGAETVAPAGQPRPAWKTSAVATAMVLSITIAGAIPSLPPGPYRLTISNQDFATLVRAGIRSNLDFSPMTGMVPGMRPLLSIIEDNVAPG